MKSDNKFIKKNKLVIVITAVLLLAAALTLSLYYGLKSRTTTTTTIATTTTKPVNKIFDISGNIFSGDIIDVSGYEINELEITISGLITNSPTNTNRNIINLVTFISHFKNTMINDIKQNTISELMNTNNRGLMIDDQIYNHQPYEKNIYLEIKITIKPAAFPVNFREITYIAKNQETGKELFKNTSIMSTFGINETALRHVKYIIMNTDPSIQDSESQDIVADPEATYRITNKISE